MSPILLGPSGYQHIIVTGSPYNRGFQHGTQAGAKVRFNVQTYKRSSSMPSAEIRSYYINDVYIPTIARNWPEGLEEMRGIAAGAEVDLADIVLLNGRYDLSRVTRHMFQNAREVEEECTSMGMIQQYTGIMPDSKAHVYIAQNWDMSSWLLENDTIIILESRDPSADNVSAPTSIIALTEAGQLARSGMNSLGLALCANSLWSSADSYPHLESVLSNENRYLPISLARRMYLACGILSSGLRTLYSNPYHMSNNVVVGSRDGIVIDLEMTPVQHFLQYPKPLAPAAASGTTLITHANHFTSVPMLARPDIHCTYSGGSSFFRDKRLHALLELRAKQKGNGDGHLGVEDIKAVFADHASYPNSLCEHKAEKRSGFAASGSETMTVASVIYDVTNLEMHVCKGNPCSGVWEVYKLD